MRRLFAGAVVLFVCLCKPALALTYIDLFQSPQTGGPYSFAGPCYCEDAYATGFFSVTPGDTVNFGRITTAPVWLNNHYGYPPIQLTFALTINTDINNPAFWVSPNGETPTTFDLTSFVIPSDVHFIQFAMLGFGYDPPPRIGSVPEPSTWAMLLIGFAGVSFVTYRRRLTAKTPLSPA